nr:Alkaline phosphatase precursor [Klebsiella pneumoniae]
MTDSAASATARTTGVKTYNGALGVDIHENSHQTILELAKAAGWPPATFPPPSCRTPPRGVGGACDIA